MAKGNPNPTHKFQKGNTLASENNNSKGKRIKRSPLRKTLAKLQSLEPYALALIEKSVREQEVDRESLATSKWLVSNLMTLTKSAIQEEDVLNNLRLKLAESDREEDEAAEQERTPSGAVFSLFVNEAAKKDKE